MFYSGDAALLLQLVFCTRQRHKVLCHCVLTGMSVFVWGLVSTRAVLGLTLAICTGILFKKRRKSKMTDATTKKVVFMDPVEPIVSSEDESPPAEPKVSAGILKPSKAKAKTAKYARKRTRQRHRARQQKYLRQFEPTAAESLAQAAIISSAMLFEDNSDFNRGTMRHSRRGRIFQAARKETIGISRGKAPDDLWSKYTRTEWHKKLKERNTVFAQFPSPWPDNILHSHQTDLVKRGLSDEPERITTSSPFTASSRSPASSPPRQASAVDVASRRSGTVLRTQMEARNRRMRNATTIYNCSVTINAIDAFFDRIYDLDRKNGKTVYDFELLDKSWLFGSMGRTNVHKKWIYNSFNCPPSSFKMAFNLNIHGPSFSYGQNNYRCCLCTGPWRSTSPCPTGYGLILCPECTEKRFLLPLTPADTPLYGGRIYFQENFMQRYIMHFCFCENFRYCCKCDQGLRCFYCIEVDSVLPRPHFMQANWLVRNQIDCQRSISALTQANSKLAAEIFTANLSNNAFSDAGRNGELSSESALSNDVLPITHTTVRSDVMLGSSYPAGAPSNASVNVVTGQPNCPGTTVEVLSPMLHGQADTFLSEPDYEGLIPILTVESDEIQDVINNNV